MTRRLPRSLHARMLALALVATLVALAVAAAAMTGVLERFVTQGLDRRLDGTVAVLASAVDDDGRVDTARLRGRLGALGGEPGWRWRIAAPWGTIGSADLPALATDAPAAPPPPPPGAPPPPDAGPAPFARPAPLDGVLEDGVRLHARRLTIATTRGPVTLTAAAPRAVIQRPIRAAIVPLLAVLAVLAVLLTASTLIQLRLGLRPLRRLGDQVAAIRTGAATRVDEDVPSELAALAAELNALADANAAALATARASAANLAHALKTPVAALAIALRGEAVAAGQVARIDATIRHHLARARAAAIDRRAATAVGPAIDGLVAVLAATARARGVAIVVAAADDGSVAVEPTDFDEMVGNLLDNAVRHARARVWIEAGVGEDARRIVLAVIDDGPGIAAADRARATAPGVRLDERGGGHGFGLSIVAELAALYGGTLALDDAPGGGLAATLTLPAAVRT